MKVIQFIAAAIIIIFITSCGSANRPVQTASESDSTHQGTTPGTTPVLADSVKANVHGPDQMVPENSGPAAVTESASK